VDSGGTTVECGESGTLVPTVANGGILANQNPAASSDARCPGLDDGQGAIDFTTGRAVTDCSTGPSYTLDWWKDTDDGVSQCFAPSKVSCQILSLDLLLTHVCSAALRRIQSRRGAQRGI
jgi:hypothetical protein